MTECHPVAGLKEELHCLMGALKKERREEEKANREKFNFIVFLSRRSGAAQEQQINAT